jgi:hypothetical protein
MPDACARRSAEADLNQRELPDMEWAGARRRAYNEFMQAAFLYDLLLQQPWLAYDAERRTRLHRAFAKVPGAEEPESLPVA